MNKFEALRKLWNDANNYLDEDAERYAETLLDLEKLILREIRNNVVAFECYELGKLVEIKRFPLRAFARFKLK